MYFPSTYKNAAIGNGARLELLSGNPIPFSIVVLCLSLISFVSWNKDSQKEKIQSIIQSLDFGIIIGQVFIIIENIMDT